MTLEQIKSAVLAGRTVHWMNESYMVTVDNYAQWFIVWLPNQYAIGLTWRDGVTLNGKELEFYIGE